MPEDSHRLGMTLWLVAFRTSHTSLETRCLVQADSEEDARRFALEAWNTPFVSPVDGYEYPIESYDEIVVVKHEPEGPVLRWWKEPRV